MTPTLAAWGPLERATAEVRDGIAGAAERLAALGVPVPRPSGRLLRPLVAHTGAGGEADGALWMAALAVQLAHEASLVHDDVIDGATTRRGEPTRLAHAGPAAAIVEGDHLLTGAYRAAALTGDLEFVTLFARAVERTVAGERRQAAAREETARREWREIVLGKSGELFGCALAAGAVLAGSAEVERRFELGRRIGLVYHMLDDLLDYCPSADTGKAPLADYACRRWTWPLAHVPSAEFGLPPEIIVGRLFASDAEDAPAGRALAQLEKEIDELTRDLCRELGPGAAVQSLLEEWRLAARRAVRAERSRAAFAHSHADDVAADPPAVATTTMAAAGEVRLALDAPAAGEWMEYLGQHGRSFRFAASLMPARERERVAAVYAWCRYTDDIVDRARPGDPLVDARLDEWLARSRDAYEGRASGVALLDEVMGATREAGVPFTYAAELIAGMRMDLRHRRYETLGELSLYTYRAAGTVGLWLAELYGVRDRWALERAAALGQAMQLTNIVRDVGEDLARGRLYLPLERVRAHGLSEAEIARALRDGGTPGDGWRALLEELMQHAERDYRAAVEALPALPPAFRRAVAVAASVYAGIHDAVRRIDHDTLHRRAATTVADKVSLATRALLHLDGRQPWARGGSIVARPLVAEPT